MANPGSLPYKFSVRDMYAFIFLIDLSSTLKYFRNPMEVKRVTAISWLMLVTKTSLRGHPWPSTVTIAIAPVVEDHPEEKGDHRQTFPHPPDQHLRPRTRKENVVLTEKANRAHHQGPANPPRPTVKWQARSPMESPRLRACQGTLPGFLSDLAVQELPVVMGCL